MRRGSPLLAALCLLLAVASPSAAGVVAQYRGGTATFPAHTFSPGTVRATIPLGLHPLPPADEYVLDFWLKYQGGWLEGQGGKIAGLGGGRVTTGCTPIRADGWSVRYMWEPMRMYTYHQERPGPCGDSDSFTPGTLPVEQWTRLTQRVRVNTPNVHNGIVQVWINGRQTYSRTNLRLRGNVSASTARVDRVILLPFRGGADASWAVSRETTMEFSRFWVLDCLPAFEGGPTTAPTCSGLNPGEGPLDGGSAPHPVAAPRNLRLLQ